ncbi:MAG: HAD hydrolase family protein [Caldithrix sp.]|nr:HAD hydrolase family protein [Caldithrix sp.]
MIKIVIPGYRKMELSSLVLDYNGTLAVDGKLVSAVKEKLPDLARHLKIHVITADTFGAVKYEMGELPCEIVVIKGDKQAEQKLNYIKNLNAEKVVAIGNGRNDHLMLQYAGLGIATIQTEGSAALTLQSADIVVTDIGHALDLLNQPNRIKATLRQ